jgi:hypothetical protein
LPLLPATKTSTVQPAQAVPLIVVVEAAVIEGQGV